MSENNIKVEYIANANSIPHSSQTARIPRCPEQVPPIGIGTCTYYDDRNTSFIERRGKKKEPPTYYIHYGFKYCSKFKKDTYSNLTKEGQVWLDQTLIDLQIYMEKGVVDRAFVSVNNTKFNERYKLANIYDEETGDIIGVEEEVKEFYKGIECREDEFKDFAFATHPDAYRPLKMQDLLIEDLFRIAKTPEWKEWLAGGTWEQAFIMYDKMDVSMIAEREADRAVDAVAETVNDAIDYSVDKALEILDKVFE